VIGVVFGLVFVEANSVGLPARYQAPLRVAGALAAAALFVGIGRARRAAAQRPASPSRTNRFGPGYWLVVAAEVAALVAGLIVINRVFHARGLAVAWIAVVVGVHFFGMAVLWRLGLFMALGAALTLLGAVGFALHAGGASNLTVALVSGVGSGAALYLAVAGSLAKQAG